GQRERPGGEIRRFRQSRPGAHGRAGGAAGDPVECAVQAGERGEADGGGDATADRPGGLGQAEEGAGTAGAGGRVGRAAHIHPKGGGDRSFVQGPSAADLKFAGQSSAINLVVGAADKKVYFFNGSGVIGSPMKLKDFMGGSQ